MRTKDTYYFPHDYEPTSDPKIQALIGEYGASGYGVYWRIVEMLHSDQTHKLPFKQYIFLAIAKQMLANAEQIQAIISYCIDTCELFHNDSEFFWSERVLKNIEERNKLSEIRAVAGRAGAIAKQTVAKASKGKESKVNKIKEDNKYKIIPPTLEDIKIRMEERNITSFSAETFFSNYERIGWMVG
ncbi:MAG: DUF4373 domain-containing protein, partial [Acholeplasmataceae bacterium]|nr:DUF4373 domain-containing protein [Acholeplasmataceae bacterium]